MEIVTDCCRLSGFRVVSEWETPGAQPCERTGDPGRERGKGTIVKYALRLLTTWMFPPGERTLPQHRVEVNSPYSLQPSSFFLSHISHITCTCSVMSYSLRCCGLDCPSPHHHLRLLCPWGSLDKNTGVGCRFFLQESSQPRDWTHVSYVSCFAGKFFTAWAIGEWGTKNIVNRRKGLKEIDWKCFRRWREQGSRGKVTPLEEGETLRILTDRPAERWRHNLNTVDSRPPSCLT